MGSARSTLGSTSTIRPLPRSAPCNYASLRAGTALRWGFLHGASYAGRNLYEAAPHYPHGPGSLASSHTWGARSHQSLPVYASPLSHAGSAVSPASEPPNLFNVNAAHHLREVVRILAMEGRIKVCIWVILYLAFRTGRMLGMAVICRLMDMRIRWSHRHRGRVGGRARRLVTHVMVRRVLGMVQMRTDALR